MPHTPAPWTTKNLKRGNAIVANGNNIFLSNHYGNDEANARRVVAAVNACEGIRVEALERGAVKRMLQILTTIAGLSPAASAGQAVAGSREILAEAGVLALDGSNHAVQI